jgi:hypothetical protein
MRASEAPAPPWWLAPGSEQCPFCLARYAWEAEIRCAFCDGPGCPPCMQSETVAVQTVCPACADEEAG